LATQYNYTANSDSDLTSTTQQANPGVVDVLVCTVTSCSPQSSRRHPVDRFFLYPPGDPNVDSMKPAKGPSTGGTVVVITGENLSSRAGDESATADGARR